MDQLEESLANLPPINNSENNSASDEYNNNSARRTDLTIDFSKMTSEGRKIIFEFLNEKRIYYPERKIKIFNKFYKFHDRPIPNPLLRKKDLAKKNLGNLKEICKRYDINHSNKDKMEIVSAIIRYQNKGDIGKKENCFDGMPLSLLEPLDRNGFSIEDYDFNSVENNHITTSIILNES